MCHFWLFSQSIGKTVVAAACFACICGFAFAQPRHNTLTTANGAPVGDNAHSLTVGQDGPTLLEDGHLIEKLASLNRERIPERVVHARGAGAYGEFECAGDFSALTKANFLSARGKKTPMFVRFSTFIGSKGTPETVRDPRGFALRFYTEDGNYDIVGNDAPVFFIRDAIKFPDLVHALKPSPVYNKQDPNRYFDFFAHSPEATYMITLMYTDFGIPANYRQMPGSSVHAFKWINAQGNVSYVKYSWESEQGNKNLTPEEAAKIQGKDIQHATVDLYQNIDRGNFPAWKVYVQILRPQQLNDFDFNPLDATKIWPEAIAKKQYIGRFVLNRVPDNFFAEVEQAGLAPGNLVAGIEASEDKLLQGRLFAYADAQRYRIGANFSSLPVNTPIASTKNYYQDGAMATTKRKKTERNYEPHEPPQGLTANKTFRHSPIHFRNQNPLGVQTRLSKPNNYKQAGEFYRSLGEVDRQHLIYNLTLDLSQVKNPVIVHKMIAHFTQADQDYGQRLAKALRVPFDQVMEAVKHMQQAEEQKQNGQIAQHQVAN